MNSRMYELTSLARLVKGVFAMGFKVRLLHLRVVQVPALHAIVRRLLARDLESTTLALIQVRGQLLERVHRTLVYIDPHTSPLRYARSCQGSDRSARSQ